MHGPVFLVLACFLATPVAAEVLTGKEAQRLLFSERGHKVLTSNNLTDVQRKIVRGIVPLMAEQLREPVRYYASIAFSPDDGMVHESLQGAMNHHSYMASDRAAVKACNALKSRSARDCEVAARVVPKRFRERALTLSIDATVGFKTTYLKAKAPKSFAISTTAGNWGMGTSDREALKNCELNGAPGDCRVVIRD